MDEDEEGATTEISRNRAETEWESEGVGEGVREGAQEGEKSWTCEIRAKMKEREEKREGEGGGRREERVLSIDLSRRVAPLPSLGLVWTTLSAVCHETGSIFMAALNIRVRSEENRRLSDSVLLTDAAERQTALLFEN